MKSFLPSKIRIFCLVVISCLSAITMGLLLSRPWVPGEELDIFTPDPWPQEHTDEDGYVKPFKDGDRFQNPWMSGRPNVVSFFSDYCVNDYSNIPSTASDIDPHIPVVEPVIRSGGPASAARMTWIGHASVIAEVDGVTVLTDPIFSERCSAVSFIGPKRFRPPALTQDQIPQLDAVVISHSHYDHLDLASVQDIAKSHPKCEFFVPEGLKSWMVANTAAEEDRITELSWWEEARLKSNPEVRFALTPANHWCKRTIMDDNKVLWGSWAVLGPRNSFWFGGDTGYCEAFKQIGKKYGPFTMAAIPIGAYQPNWFMKYQHVHPGEAVEIHKDINSTKSLGIHWGTFKLTSENYLEPKQLLEYWLAKNGLSSEVFVTTEIGGSVEPAKADV